jgi:cytochrome c oxidase assembly protein subunit 15
MVGAVVTGYGAGMSVPDWPTTYGYWFYPLRLWLLARDVFMEHGHRTLAQLVGVLVLALAAVVWRSDRRKWMRRLVLAAVLGVIIQGVLGGLRVVADERLLARVHGCVAPLLLALCAVMVSATSGRWLAGGAAVEHPAARRLHCLLWAITAGIYLEIVLGTLLRVPSFAVGGNWFEAVVRAKVIAAGLIAAGLARLWFAGRSYAPVRGMIAVRVRLLALVFLLQIVLAGGTWATHYGWPAWFTDLFGTIRYTVVETGPWQLALTTLHVGVGALSLAIASSITLWSYRLWRELPN